MGLLRLTGLVGAAVNSQKRPYHGLPPYVTQAYAEEVFWLAIDPGTYRSLTLGRGLSPAAYETWIGNYYDKMLLA